MGISNVLTAFAEAGTVANSNLGLIALAAAIAMIVGAAAALGESWIACHALDGMTRNPEMEPKLRSTMILAIALDESTSIYALIVSILLIFILGAPLVG